MIHTGFPDKAALITRDGAVSYSELFLQIQRYAQTFSDQRGEKVAILSSNRAEWIYAFYAAWINNCCVVTMDAASSKEDIAYIINDCKPAVIFIGEDQRNLLQDALAIAEFKPAFRVFEEISDVHTTDVTPPTFSYTPEQLAVIIYTSGTTGFPKGVMLSFGNLIANVKGVSEDIPIFTSDRQVLVLLPLHHIFPLAGSMLAPLKAGGTVVISPSMQAADILETLKKNQVNIMIGVPRLYELLYKSIRAKVDEKAIARLLYKVVRALHARGLAKKIFKKVHDGLGGHLEVMVAGGAALNPEVGSFFYNLGFDVLEGYGMTEAAPMITFTRPGNIKIGLTGQALPGLKMEIRDGEIVASGPNIMMGYYNRPEETAEVLKDGWLYTGDLGTLDDNGFLRITGRKKEIIVLPNGKNISPVELETRLSNGSNLIKEIAVFFHKEMLHAMIVVDAEALKAAGISNIRQHFRDVVMPAYNKDVSTYKRITQFTISEVEIPRTKLGKIQRFLLQECVEKIQPLKKVDDRSFGPEYKSLRTFLEQLTGKSVAPEDHLEYDLALDSLGRISVIDFVEKNFGVAIAEQEFQKYPTLAQLSAYVSTHKKWQKNQEVSWSEIIKEKVHLKLPATWPTVMLIKNAALSFFSLYFRFSASGVKNLPEGPCIIAPNHQSFFDGLFVASFMKRKTMTKTYFFAKKKHVNTLLFNFMAKRNNVIVVDTNEGLKESIQKMANVLKSGKKIIVFPEGTRTRDGALGEFKQTFAILSKELEVPVVPVVIDGAYRALPRGALFPRPFTRVRVSFMNPVYPQHYTVEGLKQKIWQVIKNKLG